MTRLTPTLGLAAVALIGTAATASATETTTRTWHLPAGVTPSDPFALWFPQTVTDPGCTWAQVDTYRYSTPAEKAAVDALDDDGLLTLTNGSPEDSPVYLSHVMVPPATGCDTPTTTTTTRSTPSTTTTATSPSPTSSTPTSTQTSKPSTSTASTTAPVRTSPTPSGGSKTSSSHVKPSPQRNGRSSTVAPPELPRTGSDNAALAALGAVLLAAGIALSRKGVRRGQH